MQVANIPHSKANLLSKHNIQANILGLWNERLFGAAQREVFELGTGDKPWTWQPNENEFNEEQNGGTQHTYLT